MNILPIYWLLLAEAAFFFISVMNIVQGILFLLLPDYTVSYFVIFGMFVTWNLNNWISYIFYVNEVTVDDLLGE